jgi:adenine-specific DNA methylase
VNCGIWVLYFFFFKQKTAYEMLRSLVGSEKRPLPSFVREDAEFLDALGKAHGVRRGGGSLFASGGAIEAEFAWHLRAWGRRVLDRARKKLAARYPTYAEFEPLRRKGKKGRSRAERPIAPRERELLAPDVEGRVSPEALNAAFDSFYLDDETNPRWVAKPTVAYLWARTAACGNCRAEIPLLKTRWLCKKAGKRVRLTMEARDDGRGVVFGVEGGVPEGAGSPAQRREHDKALGAGTMSRSGAACPCCGAVAMMGDLRAQGKAGRLGGRMTAVVVDGQRGKEYRLPTDLELKAAHVTAEEITEAYGRVPFGPPEEAVGRDRPSPNARGASGLPRYGLSDWRSLFTNRQLLALGTFVTEIRELAEALTDHPAAWREATVANLALTVSRLADRGSSLATWSNNPEKIRSTFARFALPMVWDFAESCPLTDTTGGFFQAVEWIARVAEHTQRAVAPAPRVVAQRVSAIDVPPGEFDVICTDPPYYDAIPYSDLMDFFHVWMRRVLHGLSPETDGTFSDSLGPKWDHTRADGELVDQSSRFGGNVEVSKRNYEDGMARAFSRFRDALVDSGRLVVVFANKRPDAWETLVSALIRSGFLVDASWPIETEMKTKVAGGARLSSSIWLVCRKRSATRAGWDSGVLSEMEANITKRLHDFWDAGIRGPDFVWAATGPALEAFSRYPAVRRQDAPGETFSVAEFLRHVRRMVVGFVVGRVLREEGEEECGDLDNLTTYYLLHRRDFGLRAAPAGAVILYAVSCDLSDSDLAGRCDLLSRGGDGAAEGDGDPAAASGGEAKLKPWDRRQSRGLGEPSPSGASPPLIDCLHRLMRLWRTGEQSRVDAYLEARGLWNQELFRQVAQAVLERAEPGSEERSILESIQNHLTARGGAAAPRYAGTI